MNFRFKISYLLNTLFYKYLISNSYILSFLIYSELYIEILLKFWDIILIIFVIIIFNLKQMLKFKIILSF